jgi:hypothetical protein
VEPHSPLRFVFRRLRTSSTFFLSRFEAVRLENTAGTLERARTIGFLAGVALKAIEAGNIAARLEACGSRETRPSAVDFSPVRKPANPHGSRARTEARPEGFEPPTLRSVV